MSPNLWILLFISKHSLEFPLETKYTSLECRAEQGPSSSSSGAALLVSLYLARGLGLTLQHTPPHQAGGHCHRSAGERGGGAGARWRPGPPSLSLLRSLGWASGPPGCQWWTGGTNSHAALRPAVGR